MLKILNIEPDRYEEHLRLNLSKLGNVDYKHVDSQADFEEALKSTNPNVLFARLGIHVSEQAKTLAPNLSYVITPTTGLDHIDVEALQSEGVEILSLKGEIELLRNVRSTAEHTMGLMLALMRKIPAAHRSVCQGDWVRTPFLGDELGGRVLSLLGAGRLGQLVIQYAQAFGMSIIAHDQAADSLADAVRDVQFVSLEEALRRADVLSLHLPLSDETHGLLTSEKLAMMKRGAYLINTARGEILDDDALVDALQSGHLAGAALDVVADDGRWDGRVDPKNRLFEYAKHNNNLIITPHIGGYGRDSIARTRAFMIEKLIKKLGETH